MDDMEAHPSGLDVDTSNGDGGSKLPLLALLIGLIGAILGVAGVYMGAQAANALDAYQESQATAPDETAERLESIEMSVAEVTDQLASIEERLGNMGSAQVALQRTDREMRDQTQRAFEGVSREVSANRTQLNDTTSKLEELIENLRTGSVRRSSTSAPSAQGATGSSEGTEAAPMPPPPEGVHVVEAGDTLSKIAARYGISLSQLMAANPTVDPRRMRVGQHIVIPEL